MSYEPMHYLLTLTKAIPLSFVALMPVINPIGTAIILLSLTNGVSDSTRRALAKKIALNTIGLLTAVILGGRTLLSFFGISVPIVQAAGGCVLISMGWALLNQNEAKPNGNQQVESAPDPKLFFAKTFYPFTFPITVGPGGVAVALTLSAHTTHGALVDTALGQAGAVLGIVGVAIVVYFCFAYANRVADRLGTPGTLVLMRLIAFIVVCIGAEISWTGIRTLLIALPPK